MSGLSYFLFIPKMIKTFVFVMGLSLAFLTSNASPKIEQFVANLRTLIETNSGVAMAWRIELPTVENSPVLVGDAGQRVSTSQIEEQPVCYGIIGGNDYVLLNQSGVFDEELFSTKLDNASLLLGGRWRNSAMRYSPQPGSSNAITFYDIKAGERGQDEETILGMKHLGMFNPIKHSLKWASSSVEGDMSLNRDDNRPLIRPFSAAFIETNDKLETHVSLHNPEEMFVLRYSFKDSNHTIPDSWQVLWGKTIVELQLLHTVRFYHHQLISVDTASKWTDFKSRLDWRNETILRFKDGGVEITQGNNKEFSTFQRPGEAQSRSSWMRWGVILFIGAFTLLMIYFGRQRNSITD